MSEEYEYDDEAEEYYAIRPNKTQIKKDMAVIFALSEEMAELSAGQLKLLELPEIINKAVVEASGMPHKGARKRQLKFITGQLFKIDIDPILEKLSRIKNKSAHAVREHHVVERWRDRLIAEGNDALTVLLAEQPQADRQLLRQLLRNAQKEAELGKPPKSSRLLYRQLKELFRVEGELEDDAGFESDEEMDDND
jgi:ribosome-associated protein